MSSPFSESSIMTSDDRDRINASMSNTNILQLSEQGQASASRVTGTLPTTSEVANTAYCRPTSSEPTFPNFCKQVTEDMPLYNAGGLASVAGNTSTASTCASKLHEFVSVKDFGAEGNGVTDDTKRIQAAIDYALQNDITNIYVPDGKYKTCDTLHLGWGNSFYEVNLVGPQAASFGGTMPSGAKIWPTKTDRPCDTLFQYINANIGGVGHGFPSNPASWNDNTNIPNGLQRYYPFCCISIDAYSGSTKYYPTVTYPVWTGLSSQTGLALSSRCTIDSCDFRGFGVGVITEPCGGDGNGDFTRVRNCNFDYGIYGIAICHTQSRSVEIRNCNYGFLHTFVDNSTFGKQLGQLDGGIDLCSGGAGYQAFNIGSPNTCGSFIVKSLYMEASVRIGLFSTGGQASFQIGVLFEGCQFNFGAGTLPSLPNIVPSVYIEVDGRPVKFSHCTFISNRFFVTNVTTKTVFENCQWHCGTDYETNSFGAESNAAIAIGYARFGGMHISNRNNNDGPQIVGWCEGTHFNRSTFALETQYFQPACNVSATESIVHAAAESYRDSKGRNWPILFRPPAWPFVITGGSPFTVQPTQSGMNLSGEINAANQGNTSISACLDPSDILEDQATNNIYIITSVTRNGGIGNYGFTAIQQNNFTVQTGTAVPLATVSSGPYLWLYKSIFRLPLDIYFGDFASGSINVTNIHRGDGYGGNIQANIPVGMVIAEDAYLSSMGDYAFASNGNTRVASVTNGSPGSLTLNRNAAFTGRFPIMPVLLAGVNVKPAGLQQRNVGRFTCAAAATTTISDTNVTLQSCILLTPTNAAAATLWGSAKALYILAKSARVSFTVATANAVSAAGIETFDYLIEG